jgi:hypothetical protein
MFAFFSAVNVYSKILEDKGYGDLGFYGIGTLYISLSLSCFAAPSIVGMMKIQKILIIGEFSFTIWIIAGYVATRDYVSKDLTAVAVIFGSLCNGVGSSVFWIA